MSQEGPWLELVKGIVGRLDLCAKLDMDFVEKPAGCVALSKLIKEMARVIDDEIKRRDGDGRSKGP